METTILELSKYTSNNGTNSDWTSTLCKPVKVDTNTYISVKQAFIDTRQINATTILLDQDVEWTFYFMYYIIGHGFGQINAAKTSEVPATFISPDGKPYLMCTKDENPANIAYTPTMDFKVIKIPAGIYDRTYLAEYITKQMQSMNENLASLPNMNFYAGRVLPTYDVNGNVTGFAVNPTLSPPPLSVATSLLKSMLVLSSDENKTTNYQSGYLETGSTPRLCYFVPMCDQSTPYLNVAENVMPLADMKLAQPIAENLGNYKYIFDGGVLGATQVALAYNNNNSNKFSFTYLHSPILNNGTESTGNFSYATPTTSSSNRMDSSQTAWFNSHSGIMFSHSFTNLSANPNQITDTDDNPFIDPFFQQMGMRYSDIINPDVPNQLKSIAGGTLLNFTFNYQNFLKYTTQNFYPVSGITSDTKDTYDTYQIETYANKFYTTGYSLNASDITNEIIFSNVPISSNSSAGHHLIEINYGADEGYINKDKTMMIKGIIGSFYLSGDSFEQSMGPDSIIYNPHHGVPFVLNTLNVRILNPITKEPEVLLGPNSTVYLQVSREIKDPPPEPPKDEPKKVSSK